MADKTTRDGAGRPVLGPKDPADVLDFALDWNDATLPAKDRWLEEGDTIVASVVTVTGGVLASSAFTPTVTTAWVSGGTAGTDIVVSFKITTSAGRTAERSLVVKVKEL